MDKLAELIGSLKDYFNDFVGAVIPGTVFAAGILWLYGDHLPMRTFSRQWDDWSWLPGLALIFLLGHALLSLHDLTVPLLEGIPERFRKTSASRRSADGMAESNSAYKIFIEIIRPKLTESGSSTPIDLHTARNIAMSLSSNGADLGRRFMFIALFCYGTSTAAWTLAVLDVLLLVSGVRNDSVAKAMLAVSLATALLLELRGRSFQRRALTVPFSVATAEMLVPRSGGGHVEAS